MAQSSRWFLPQSNASYEPYSYSSSREYRDDRNDSGIRIHDYERNYLDIQHRNTQHRTYESMLHPDTLEPMDPNKLQLMLNTQRNREAIPHSKRPVEVRIDGSWSLGITMSSDGVVTRIHDGTPASRAMIVFESKVRRRDKFPFESVDKLR